MTALRRIDLSNGLETHRPAVGAVVRRFAQRRGRRRRCCSPAASGVTAYDGLTGLRLWSLRARSRRRRRRPAPLLPDRGHHAASAVDPLTGHVIARAPGSAVAGSAGMFAVRGGVALGLDQGPSGEAWGYDLAPQRVIWTRPSLPWPHYFVDISGIGGSADPTAPPWSWPPAPSSARSLPSQPASPAASASGTSASGASASGAAGSASPDTQATGTRAPAASAPAPRPLAPRPAARRAPRPPPAARPPRLRPARSAWIRSWSRSTADR